jgi:AcrR family transcriptional regulator
VAERERIVLDTAARLFYARGCTRSAWTSWSARRGSAKATVYRLFPTKDGLVGAYLQRLAADILGQIDARAKDAAPAKALHELLTAVAGDLARPGFRGCAFNNASIEHDDPKHPARAAARDYRTALHGRLHVASAHLVFVAIDPQDAPGRSLRCGRTSSMDRRRNREAAI